MNKYIGILKARFLTFSILRDNYGIRKSNEVPYGVGFELGI